MPIKTIETQRLYRKIAEQLRSLISTGEFAVGSRLPAERELAKQLGVSRPSVREALIALEVEHVIEVRTGSGIYVLKPKARPPSRKKADDDAQWGPLELMRARELVESEVAALAARNAKKADLQLIDQALQQMRDEVAKGKIPREGDEAFHNAIAQACGNEVLRDTIRGYWQARHGTLFERLGDYFENQTSWDAALIEHAAVLEAIRAHDAGAARSAMQRHLKKAHTRYSASWRRAKPS
ncbi:MAG: FadR/GntR family transcriptional regulator [Rhodoferax sp.]|uniref:FadR/GntR family transcriptional regulator n=1 Tax=Polaromonas sp. TaxID=1869339 RepID=UPI0027302D25|nr:FadR/GntR family transcriptional regulator [Polaromonas sp.]MDP2257538.1 FadR/GntR family transcriptional regulator [Polaromonas sp.]MDP3617966.1 FadR/GntR family transcriptional regulator [Rhodoferax sp.]